MTRFTRRIASFLFVSSIGLVTLACDPFPDECELDDNVCEGNIANRCYRPGPESRLRVEREDCGEARTCVIRKDGPEIEPVCAQKNVPSCNATDARTCNVDVVSTCMALGDGRYTWVDAPTCAKGCKVDPTYGAGCIY